MPGQPLWLQKIKVKRAKKRSKIVRWIRCQIGWHNPPWDMCFEVYGSIMVGGPCTECHDEVFREIVWVGDVWDFPDGITQQDNMTIIHNGRMLDAVDAHVHKLLN